MERSVRREKRKTFYVNTIILASRCENFKSKQQQRRQQQKDEEDLNVFSGRRQTIFE